MNELGYIAVVACVAVVLAAVAAEWVARVACAHMGDWGEYGAIRRRLFVSACAAVVVGYWLGGVMLP